MAAAPHDSPPDNPDSATPASPRGIRNIKLIDGCIDSRDLFVGTREIVIRHRDESYRLRLTALNKLILTK
jgi:hemin uptake protein HemP